MSLAKTMIRVEFADPKTMIRVESVNSKTMIRDFPVASSISVVFDSDIFSVVSAKKGRFIGGVIPIEIKCGSRLSRKSLDKYLWRISMAKRYDMLWNLFRYDEMFLVFHRFLSVRFVL